ncbi:preprotein translocase subunit SecG [Caenispirillum bisanense]|uniref:preprotein translocase subunit SecG n=1 Tax=Caenispirillum bisanense TaxID=414052 RepID=UPI0031D54560
MITVVLVIHLLICIALVGLILLQRSEGGGLGMGGGGGGGGLISGRAAGNALTRTTGILAACFFVTSMTLALLANEGRSRVDTILDRAPATTAPAGEGEAAPQPPASDAPAAPQAPISGG